MIVCYLSGNYSRKRKPAGALVRSSSSAPTKYWFDNDVIQKHVKMRQSKIGSPTVFVPPVLVGFDEYDDGECVVI